MAALHTLRVPLLVAVLFAPAASAAVSGPMPDLFRWSSSGLELTPVDPGVLRDIALANKFHDGDGFDDPRSVKASRLWRRSGTDMPGAHSSAVLDSSTATAPAGPESGTTSDAGGDSFSSASSSSSSTSGITSTAEAPGSSSSTDSSSLTSSHDKIASFEGASSEKEAQKSSTDSMPKGGSFPSVAEPQPTPVDQAMLDKMARLARQLAITMYRKYLDSCKIKVQSKTLAEMCKSSGPCHSTSPPYDCKSCPHASLYHAHVEAVGDEDDEDNEDEYESYDYDDEEDEDEEDEDEDEDEHSSVHSHAVDGYYHEHGHDHHHKHGHHHRASAPPVSGLAGGLDPFSKVGSTDGKKVAIIQM